MSETQNDLKTEASGLLITAMSLPGGVCFPGAPAVLPLAVQTVDYTKDARQDNSSSSSSSTQIPPL